MPRFVAVSIFAANAHQTDMRSIEVFFSKYFPAVAHLSAYLFGEKKIRKMPRERESEGGNYVVFLKFQILSFGMLLN